MTRSYEEFLRPLGLKVTQFILLIALEQGRAGSTTELADLLGMERTTLIRNFQLLERQTLIKTRIDKGRRKAELTAEGRALLDRALPLWGEAQSKLVGRLGQDNWLTAKISMETLVASCEDSRGQI